MSPFTFSTQVLFQGNKSSGSLPFRGVAGGTNGKVGGNAQMRGTEEALGQSRTKLGSAGWVGYGGKVSVWGPG